MTESTSPHHIVVAGYFPPPLATDIALASLSALYPHAFVPPSHADCTPALVARVYTYGVPAITSDVGGLPTMIPAASGALSPAAARPPACADAILTAATEAYRFTARAARQRGSDTVSWDAAAPRDVLTRLDRIARV